MITEAIYQARREAEESLLGAILIESAGGNMECISRVKCLVIPEDFMDCHESHNLHSRIYQAMINSSKAPHQINVAQNMADINTLQKFDCAEMSHMISNVPCSLDYMDYAEAVHHYGVQDRIEYHARKGQFHQVQKDLAGAIRYKGYEA